jgi:hypothetical protein
MVEEIDPSKGGLVFSVDFSRLEALERVSFGGGQEAYTFKAETFWNLVPWLRKVGLSFRANSVITATNVSSLREIAEGVLEAGGTLSVCPVQTISSRFRSALEEGELERWGLEPAAFNCFRGSDPAEEPTPDQWEQVRQLLLELKDGPDGDRVLPPREWLADLGGETLGCARLLEAGIFPQLKVGQTGEIRFCCDLHDPETADWRIWDLVTRGGRRGFLNAARSNPYIKTCRELNSCNFSVNHVPYRT